MTNVVGLKTARFPRRHEPILSHNQESERISAAQKIYEILRSRIVKLDLKPGALISKRDIATEFNISQTPVREALVLLEEEGLVDIFPQSRTQVSYVDIQSAREAHFLRRSVEVEISKELVLKISAVQIIELRSLIELQKINFDEGNLKAFAISDNEFHQRMYQMADVTGLYDLLNTRRAHLDRLRNLHLPQKGKASAILSEHSAIVDSLEKRDPAAAEAAVRNHLKGTVSATEELRAHFPEYFAV
ncbi:MAG: GntR family transcriptional regulator [Rhodospirillales bacterium]|jgi:DNA-binding GntR family transcriptional regulator